ncbi:MAG: hypothetical protein JSV13_01270 [Nitrospiraceae bacterium]|nr:MAG: hypothetical protein JSV13_01270 [Nitrospiraceae bacterium]
MANTTAQRTQTRLEDFIHRARKGTAITLEITLKKHIITERVHPEQTQDMKSEIDRYLMLGDFTFRAEAEEQTVSKVYMLGSMEESREFANVNRNIANERLKMDYKRLHESGITFEEKFF